MIVYIMLYYIYIFKTIIFFIFSRMLIKENSKEFTLKFQKITKMRMKVFRYFIEFKKKKVFYQQ